jgi:hypothetical protein
MAKTFPAGQINIAPRQVLFILLFLESMVIAIAIAKAITRDLSPAHYFGENGLVTDASCIQLAIASMLALATFWTVKHSHNSQLTKNGWFWLVVSCGLVFLAFDDAYEIHEHLDLWLHRVLQIQQTDLTDLADDLIVGGYLLMSLIYVALKWRSLQIFRRSFTFFKIGFVLTALMVILDMAGNNDYFILSVVEDLTRARLLEQWLGVVEDSVKIIAEGMFIVGIYQCWQIAKSLSSPVPGDRPKVI